MTNTEERAEDTCPLTYQSRLPLSTRTVNHLADLLRRHLKAIRSRWRILPPGKIAVIVLAVLRHDQRLADMAGGNNVSESTVRRWRDELLGLLALQAPRLDRALKKLARQGGEVVLIDGTLIRTRRRSGKADRRNYSGCEYGCAVPTRGLTRTLAGPWCLVFDLSATASGRCMLAPGKADRVPIEALPPSEASSQS
ncbi:hypothetical protein OTB20_41045 [Streptomyces sp. H27-H1]|uniref:hypothetical protein n=1 Tax=Streptomyces sp. H27-H1 TaxID=2996461 RepID=UPI002271C5AC|nr:hypothetical protein [Streptomyces sp. H27-H1]MCY0932425.1 hypothetical protein [Streptomyces sp. H27-H1]